MASRPATSASIASDCPARSVVQPKISRAARAMAVSGIRVLSLVTEWQSSHPA
jgi:hypothetical protein